MRKNIPPKKIIISEKNTTSVLYNKFLKGVFAKNEMGYRLNAIKKRF